MSAAMNLKAITWSFWCEPEPGFPACAIILCSARWGGECGMVTRFRTWHDFVSQQRDPAQFLTIVASELQHRILGALMVEPLP